MDLRPAGKGEPLPPGGHRQRQQTDGRQAGGMAVQEPAVGRRHVLRRNGRGDEIRPGAGRRDARKLQRQQHVAHGVHPLTQTARVRPHAAQGCGKRGEGRRAPKA